MQFVRNVNSTVDLTNSHIHPMPFVTLLVQGMNGITKESEFEGKENRLCCSNDYWHNAVYLITDLLL